MNTFFFRSKRALFFFLLIPLISCLKKEKLDPPSAPNWKPDLGIPVAYANLSLADILQENQSGNITLTNQSDGLYVLVYRDTAESATAETIIKIPDQTPLGISVIPLNGTFNGTFPLSFGYNSLTYASFKGGDIALDLTTTNPSNIKVTLNFPDIKSMTTGQPLTVSGSSGGSLGFSLHGSLNGYEISFPSPDSIKFSISCSNVTGPGVLSAHLGFTNIQYSLLEGTFTSFDLGVMGGSNQIEIFKNILAGNIKFGNPSAKFTFDNSFGINVIDSLIYLNIQDFKNNTYQVNAGPLEGNVSINAAKVVGGSDTTAFLMDNSTSVTGNGKLGLADALSSGPQQISYSVDPKIGTNGVKGFIKDDSKLRVYGELRIPFYGSVTEYALEDTVDITMEDLSQVTFAQFYVMSQNHVPVEADLQIYLTDSTYHVIDSLFGYQSVILQAPTLNSSGAVVEASSYSTTSKAFDASRIAAIQKASKLLIKASMRSPGAPSQLIEITTSDRLSVQVGLHVKGNVKLNQ